MKMKKINMNIGMKTYLFLMFTSFLVGLFTVNMLNVTRVTLSHNRIACKCQMESE